MCSGVVEIWLSTLVRFRLLIWPFLVSLEFEKKEKDAPVSQISIVYLHM